jgi:hypothetical protein
MNSYKIDIDFKTLSSAPPKNGHPNQDKIIYIVNIR